MWMTVSTGEIAPKDVAAAWVVERLPQEHFALLDLARRAYLGEARDDWGDRAVDLMALVNYMKPSIEACPWVGAEGRPALRITFHDIGLDPAALGRLMELAEKHQVQGLGLPAFHLRVELIIGYLSEATTGARLTALLDRPWSRPGQEEPAETRPFGAPEPWTHEQAPRAPEKEARWLKLVGGAVMLGLAVILLAKPEWLAS
jgi:Domain of unknown function (DUF4111)